jgi:hypothetical protein
MGLFRWGCDKALTEKVKGWVVGKVRVMVKVEVDWEMVVGVRVMVVLGREVALGRVGRERAGLVVAREVDCRATSAATGAPSAHEHHPMLACITHQPPPAAACRWVEWIQTTCFTWQW